MYHPYLRGKQFELITLRECSGIIEKSNIVPIIEPVKKNLNSLKKTLTELIKKNVQFILVINPKCGDFKSDPTTLETKIIKRLIKNYKKYSVGYIVDVNSNLSSIRNFFRNFKKNNVALIHYGFPKGNELKKIVNQYNRISKHIFIDGTSKLYQKKFKADGVERILLRDGFNKPRSIDYPEDEHFSDLHITYEEEGMDGYGDFLIVGDEYYETGGPAYAVAIHLTYIDEDEDEDMRIKHFVSDRSETPVDPAGKFFEALSKLVQGINGPDTFVFQSKACKEYQDLYKTGHFPGLGYVKKLSMNHHIELIANFLKS